MIAMKKVGKKPMNIFKTSAEFLWILMTFSKISSQISSSWDIAVNFCNVIRRVGDLESSAILT